MYIKSIQNLVCYIFSETNRITPERFYYKDRSDKSNELEAYREKWRGLLIIYGKSETH